MQSKRLFTFGCSYTKYTYPTWADFLGLEFSNYENWGIPGIGCRAIAERITECHARNSITKDDVVIVQWTTHLRHDFYNAKPILNRTEHWKTYGSVFSVDNQKLYDQKWLDNFFFEPAYIMHCLNAILTTQLLLESIGCKWFMTSIGDWQKLSCDLDDTTGSGEKRPIAQSIKDTFPELSFYIKPIWEDRADKWIPPIALEALNHPDLWWWFNEQGKEPWREQHPTPAQYVIWLNKYLRPQLGLADPPKEQQLWVDQLEKLKKDYNDDREKIRDVFLHKQDELDYWPTGYWPTPYKGFN
jgi:hypothetical protein